MTYPTEALDRAERTIRDEGNSEHWNINSTQFMDDDDLSETARYDDEVDLDINTESESRQIAQRLANLVGYRVIITKFVKCGALADNFEEDEDGKITVMPWKVA